MSRNTFSIARAVRRNFPADCFDSPTMHDVRAACYELVGTTLFLLFAFMGCTTASNVYHETQKGSSVESLEYCARSFGLSLFVWVSVFFRVTGGVFNPAIALALFAIGALRFWRFIFYCIAQLVGAIIATALVKGLLPGPIAVQNDLAPGVSTARGVFIETFSTGMLVMAVLLLAADKRTLSKAIAPLGIAGALYIGHMTTINYTGTSMNPARSFGPAVVDGGFRHTHWIFWVGPIFGSTAATIFYKWLQHSKYWDLGNCDADELGPLPVLAQQVGQVESRSAGTSLADGFTDAFSGKMSQQASNSGQTLGFENPRHGRKLSGDIESGPTTE